MTSLAQNRAFESAEAVALAGGYTRWVELSCAMFDIEGWVRPDAGLGGIFELVCADDGATLKLKGDMFVLAR